jgi:hypothetical protein
MKRFLIISILTMLPLVASADALSGLEAKCGEAYGGLFKRLVIKDLPPIELVVVSDSESPNVALNPNLKHNIVDLDESRRTVYLQTPDGGRGLKLVFTKGIYNALRMYDKVTLDLNGCKVGKVEGTEALYVTDVTPLNVVKVIKGSEADVPVKEKYISEITDKDLFTRITLKETEFVFRNGAMVNFAEFYGQYVPEIHSAYKNKMISNCDGTCCVIRDSKGGAIYMALNTLCSWIREKTPQGSGNVSGVLVWERNRRYGDKDAKYYIRPMCREDIRVDEKKKSALWRHYIAWIPENVDGANFDFEKAGFGPEGINDRLLNNVGPVSYLSYDAGNGKLRKAGSFNNLLSRDGSGNLVNASIKTYATLNQWYQWGKDGQAEGTKSIIVEFSTAKLKANQLQFAFDIVGSDANLLSCRGLPLRWKVEYSVDGGEFKPISEADGTETFGLRPMPAEAKFDSKYNHTYQMMYDHGLGLQQHLYNLPAETIGKDKVVVRITPAVARFFHLSKDPSKNVEVPVVHDQVKPGNKSNATFRLGSVFVDYK